MAKEKIYDNRAPKRTTEWGEYKGAYKFEDPIELPEDYRKVLFKLLYVQAETEFASVQMHQPWLNMGPTPGDRLMQAKIIADEMRHAWQMCELLKAFGKEGEEAIEELMNKNLGEYKLDAFNIEFEDWVDLGAFLCLLDRVGMYQVAMMEGCSYAPLARVIPLIAVEEKFHINSGFNVLKRAANNEEGLGTKEDAQRAINKWYPRALDSFGNSGSEWSETLVKLGIKKWTNEKTRAAYKAELDELILKIGCEVPDEFEGRRFL